MRSVFADTAYWIALTNPRDNLHAQATGLAASLADTQIVTTDEVLTEYLAHFSRGGPLLRAKCAQAVRVILDDQHVTVLPPTRLSFLAGLGLYEQRPDKGYSLTDCISMETMRREGLTEVATSDRHFEQEGLRVLLGEGQSPPDEDA